MLKDNQNVFTITHDDYKPDVIISDMPKDQVNTLYSNIQKQINTQSIDDENYLDGSIADLLIEAIIDKGYTADYFSAHELYIEK